MTVKIGTTKEYEFPRLSLKIEYRKLSAAEWLDNIGVAIPILAINKMTQVEKKELCSKLSIKEYLDYAREAGKLNGTVADDEKSKKQ